MYKKVIQALDSCGLTEEYKTKFKEHEMDDDAVILTIEDESLAGIWKELMPKLSHRVKFICAFKKNNFSKASIMKECTVDSATSIMKESHGSVSPTPITGDVSSDEKETQNIIKQVRGILNKLTSKNYEELSQKFLKLELNDRDDRISAVMDVVFERAITEPNFSPVCARMVHYVCSNSQETAKKFRKEILDQSQKYFQKTNKDEDEIKAAEAAIQTAPEDKKVELIAELEEKLTEMRRRSLGNVRFIGELYKLQMLTSKIMVGCVYMLLANQDEESYKCLCVLLTTTGKKLDNQLKDQEGRVKHAKQNNQPLPKFIPEDQFMAKTFDKLRKLSNTANLSSRIRFALLDLVELRQNDWMPRRGANAPKTIDEVRTDAIRQEQEENNKIAALPNAIGFRRTPLLPQPMSTQGKKGSDWNTIPSNKPSRFQSQAKERILNIHVEESLPEVSETLKNVHSQYSEFRCLPSLESENHNALVSKMVPVLRNHENVKEIFDIFQENSWDVGEIDTKKAAVEAIFQVCFIDGKWVSNKLDKYLPLIETKATHKLTFPELWAWISSELITRFNVNRDGEQVLWNHLFDF